MKKTVFQKKIRIGNKYIGLNIRGLQVVDLLNILREVIILSNFHKAYGPREEEAFFPYDWFNSGEKLNLSQLADVLKFGTT